jgi:N-methylhydantoinase B/oxoprolinase/acetone carboxylase alpha subunit
VFRGEMPGSGGHGDPFERDPAAVLEDIRQEKMTVEHARTAYGVLVDPETMSVDRDATDAYRARIREGGA